jgi:aryl-alcohol dehydrogenase-like predicted oxidoreductase
MQTGQLGRTGPHVARLGLGAMGMSDFCGPADRAESSVTIHAALDAGMTRIDTGDFYGRGHNEMLIAEALAGRPRDSFRLSVKFGVMRDPAGNWSGRDARRRGRGPALCRAPDGEPRQRTLTASGGRGSASPARSHQSRHRPPR